ncbi:MAG: hypothetical protein AAB847_01680 [Patescibacteria group bacterium]
MSKQIGVFTFLIVSGFLIFVFAYPDMREASRITPEKVASEKAEPIQPPALHDSIQQVKIETAMKAMEPKFQALMPIAQSENEKIFMFVQQIMMFGQSVTILGMTDSPRAQKRLESGLAILQDLVDEAYETALEDGLIIINP